MKTILAACWLIVIQSCAQSQHLQVQEKSSTVSFKIRNFGLTVEGSLAKPEGKVQYDRANPSSSKFELKIASGTIDTGIGLRDRHLLGAEYLDAERYPYMKFVSTAVRRGDAENTIVVEGDLTIRATTKKIQVPVTVTPSATGYSFRGTFEISRTGFGVGRNSISLADEVSVDFEISAATPL
jgi:polyisoprenoid-binding protein YceI